MSTHEWVENTCLIFFNKVVIGWIALESWQIRACEDHTRDTEWKCHLQIWPNICIVYLAVTSPKSSIALRTKECGSCQYERSELVVVSFQESLPRRSMHQGTICIMNPSMLNDSTVSLDVGVVHWHTHLIDLGWVVEDWRLVHIVPCAVEVIGSLEVFA